MTLFITKRAKRNFQKIDDYIRKDFGKNAAKGFSKSLTTFSGYYSIILK